MTYTHWQPGPYSLSKLAQEVQVQLPELIKGGPDLLAGLTGEHKLDGASRLAVQLRMARLLGCPVCAKLFPPLGAPAGLSDQAVQSALAGTPEGLTPEQHGAVVWAGAILVGDGATPDPIPEAALALTAPQRHHLLFMMRLELVIHATGLMFLPHGWIDRVRMG
jgi:hypothetical protein